MNCTTPNILTPDQQTLLAAWQRHTYAEFVLKDADAALANTTRTIFCRRSRPISSSRRYRKRSAVIASSRKWSCVLPTQSRWTGSFLRCAPPGGEQSLLLPLSSALNVLDHP